MFGHFGFSYVGLLFLLLLFLPNLFWTKKKPQGYTSRNENKILSALERTGEILTTACVLIFDDFNLHGFSGWSWWLVAAFLLMILYELWWIRYFRSKRTLSDFYSSFFGIPLAGATLPVVSFFLLGIYGRVLFLSAAAVLLGIGHIGIHLQHSREIKQGRDSRPC